MTPPARPMGPGEQIEVFPRGDWPNGDSRPWATFAVEIDPAEAEILTAIVRRHPTRVLAHVRQAIRDAGAAELDAARETVADLEQLLERLPANGQTAFGSADFGDVDVKAKKVTTTFGMPVATDPRIPEGEIRIPAPSIEVEPAAGDPDPEHVHSLPDDCDEPEECTCPPGSRRCLRLLEDDAPPPETEDRPLKSIGEVARQIAADIPKMREDAGAAPVSEPPEPEAGPPSGTPAPPSQDSPPAPEVLSEQEAAQRVRAQDGALSQKRRAELLDVDTVRHALGELGEATRAAVARHLGFIGSSTVVHRHIDALEAAGRIKPTRKVRGGFYAYRCVPLEEQEQPEPEHEPEPPQEPAGEQFSDLETYDDVVNIATALGPEEAAERAQANHETRMAVEERIEAWLGEHGPATSADIAAATGLERGGQTTNLLGRLKQRGRIDNTGGPAPVQWYRTPPPSETSATRIEAAPDGTEQGRVLSALRLDPKRIPEVADELGLKPTVVAHAMALLEREGEVTKIAGGKYKAVHPSA